MMRLYGEAGSSNTVRICTLLNMLSVPFKFSPIITVENSKNNHFKKVPVLEDENMGVTIFEFSSILRYLIDKYCEKSCCDDQKKRCEELQIKRHVENWLNENNNTFHLPGLTYSNHHKRFSSETACDEDIVGKNIASLETTLDVYEKILRNNIVCNLATPDISRVPYTAHMIEINGKKTSFREKESTWLWLTKVAPSETWKKKLPASV